MKVVAIADIHSKHQHLNIPHGDVLLICGDITHLGSFAELKQEVEWIKKLPHPYKVALPGNHDQFAENLMNKKMENQLRDFLKPIIYLRDSETTINGVKFFGTPWVLDWSGAFNLTADEIKPKWDAIPSDVNVLLCHQPPAGIHDGGRGCPQLLRRISRLPSLKLCVFGHVHEQKGISKRNGITFVNAAQKVIPGPCTVEV